MAKELFLMKGLPYEERKHGRLQGKWKWSLKLDGMRAFWDGGISKGRVDVPWCRGERATGLWSNNGKIVHAPDWFTADWPRAMIDGELWAGCGQFQEVMSTCKKHVAIDSQWERIQFMTFDSVPGGRFFSYREINIPTCKLFIGFETIAWARQLCLEHDVPWSGDAPSILEGRTHRLVAQNDFLNKDLPDILDDVVSRGHEGIMLRDFAKPWSPNRCATLLKLKPFLDDEAIVKGYQMGRGGKFDGIVGALICDWRGRELRLSGLTDEERGLHTIADRESNISYFDDNMECFQIGQKVTFKYRELTDGGMPKDARYFRKRGEE